METVVFVYETHNQMRQSRNSIELFLIGLYDNRLGFEYPWCFILDVSLKRPDTIKIELVNSEIQEVNYDPKREPMQILFMVRPPAHFDKFYGLELVDYRMYCDWWQGEQFLHGRIRHKKSQLVSDILTQIDERNFSSVMEIV